MSLIEDQPLIVRAAVPDTAYLDENNSRTARFLVLCLGRFS